MSKRVNVWESINDAYPAEGPRLLGWFDPSKAEFWSPEDSRDENGNSYNTGTNLLRTAGGRWVLEHWSRWQGSKTSREFVPSARAREYLIANHYDDDVEKYFGELEPETGPDLG